MKPLLTQFWQRRWCRIMVLVAALLGIALLLPFARQMVFGPKINGIPWCIWQEQARIAADPARHRSSWAGKLRGLLTRDDGMLFWGTVWNNDELVPIHIEMVHDRDVMFRRFALRHLGDAFRRGKPDLLPVLRPHLEDDDAECRLLAAKGIWRMTKEPTAKAAIVSLADCADNQIRENVVETLYRMAATEPDLFEPLLKLAEDPNIRIRRWAVHAMRFFGKRGVPAIGRALDDPLDPRTAAVAAADLGPDAAELIPKLLALQADGPAWIRQPITQALSKIDPKRFPAAAISSK